MWYKIIIKYFSVYTSLNSNSFDSIGSETVEVFLCLIWLFLINLYISSWIHEFIFKNISWDFRDFRLKHTSSRMNWRELFVITVSVFKELFQAFYMRIEYTQTRTCHSIRHVFPCRIQSQKRKLAYHMCNLCTRACVWLYSIVLLR